VLPATTPLHDLSSIPALELEETDAATIGGYVTHRLGRIPASGELVPAGAWDIVVERASDHRVITVRLVQRAADRR
ncbi:MAG: transporter associated domain-containing protein, partial [Dehalococcoidia bacterium]